jgi:hypothetical protein
METATGKQTKELVAYAERAKLRLGTRTIEVHRVRKKPLHKIEAEWTEKDFEPHGWITLELGKKLKLDDWKRIIRAYFRRVGKINKQHIEYLLYGGIQRKSFTKGKLHFHIPYHFEHTQVCTRVMELMWKQTVRKILRKNDKPSLEDISDEIELGVMLDCGLHRHLPKEEKDFHAYAYEYKRINDPSNKGTTIQYIMEPKKHKCYGHYVACPKYLAQCRRGKCEHHKRLDYGSQLD